MTAYRPVLQQLCNSCASLAGLVLSFIACFILLVIAPLMIHCCKSTVTLTLIFGPPKGETPSKVSFRPAIICQVYLPRAHTKEPKSKMHKNSWWPEGNPLGELTSFPPDPLAGGEGAYYPPQESHPRLRSLGFFGPLGLVSPPRY